MRLSCFACCALAMSLGRLSRLVVIALQTRNASYPRSFCPDTLGEAAQWDFSKNVCLVPPRCLSLRQSLCNIVMTPFVCRDRLAVS